MSFNSSSYSPSSSSTITPGMLNRLNSAADGIDGLETNLDNLDSNREKRLELAQARGNVSDFKGFVTPIGFIRTPFPSKTGTPRQGSISQNITAELTISRKTFCNPSNSLDGLEDFEYVWLIYWFHLNGKFLPKAKVKPPRLDGELKGVFATRSPHRPNSIGLSLVKLEEIKGDTLFLSGIDMVDGTPILDVKPFIEAYDTPPTKVRSTPTWLKRLDEKPAFENVEFGDQAMRQLKRFHPRCSENCPYCLEHLNDNNLVPSVANLLMSDLRSHYRKEKCSDRIQFISLDRVNLSVWYDSNGLVHVLDASPRSQNEASTAF